MNQQTNCHSDDPAFDYEIPHTCEYEVDAPDLAEGCTDCSKPAPYRAMWSHEFGDCEMWLCEEHFKFVKKCEEAA